LDPVNDPYADIGVSKTDNAGCTTNTPLLRFKWFDPTGTYSAIGDRIVTAHVVVYYLTSSQIVRATCVGTGPSATFLPGHAPAAPSLLTLAKNVGSASSWCDAGPSSCPALPRTVSL